MTNAELEFMAKMPARLGAIEKQLERVANALDVLLLLLKKED